MDRPKNFYAIKQILDTISVNCDWYKSDAVFEAIRAEARAEALKEAADRAEEYLSHWRIDEYTGFSYFRDYIINGQNQLDKE
jgi:hypothetical protein